MFPVTRTSKKPGLGDPIAMEFNITEKMWCDTKGTIYTFLHNRTLRKIAIVPLSREGNWRDVSIGFTDPRYEQLKAVLGKFGKKQADYFVRRARSVTVHAAAWNDVSRDIFRSFFDFKLRELDAPKLTERGLRYMVKDLKDKMKMLDYEGEKKLSKSIGALVDFMERDEKEEVKKYLPSVYARASGINAFIRPLLDTIKEIYVNG